MEPRKTVKDKDNKPHLPAFPVGREQAGTQRISIKTFAQQIFVVNSSCPNSLS